MKGVLPCLVPWACRAGTRDFCPSLGCSRRPSTKYVFPHHTLFHFLCPQCSASWAGSRAASPVSSYVSLKQTHLESWREVHAPDLTKPGSSILNSEKVLICRPRHVNVNPVFQHWNADPDAEQLWICSRSRSGIDLYRNRSGSSTDLDPERIWSRICNYVYFECFTMAEILQRYNRE